MKKLVKVLIILIVILIMLLVINYIRNIVILEKIKNNGKQFINSNNYHVILKTTADNYNCTNEIYYKNNICLINTSQSGVLSEVYWKDYSTGECYAYYPITSDSRENVFNDDLIKSIKFRFEATNLNISPFSIITIKDDCYVLKNDFGEECYYNKENVSFIKATDINNSVTSNLISEFTVELDSVTDKDIEKPKF